MLEAQAIPISVYSDSDIELFVDKQCIVASIQFGYARIGVYQVELTTHYKTRGYFCKPFWDKVRGNAEFRRECDLVVYKMRMFTVNTHRQMMISTGTMLIDDHGNILKMLPDGRWESIADLTRVRLSSGGHMAVSWMCARCFGRFAMCRIR